MLENVTRSWHNLASENLQILGLFFLHKDFNKNFENFLLLNKTKENRKRSWEDLVQISWSQEFNKRS